MTADLQIVGARGGHLSCEFDKLSMSRQDFNSVVGCIPVGMSLSAFALVMLALFTGWDSGDTDDGAAAHAFQLLVVLQVPFILAYCASFARFASWPCSSHALRLQCCPLR